MLDKCEASTGPDVAQGRSAGERARGRGGWRSSWDACQTTTAATRAATEASKRPHICARWWCSRCRRGRAGCEVRSRGATRGSMTRRRRSVEGRCKSDPYLCATLPSWSSCSPYVHLPLSYDRAKSRCLSRGVRASRVGAFCETASSVIGGATVVHREDHAHLAAPARPRSMLPPAILARRRDGRATHLSRSLAFARSLATSELSSLPLSPPQPARAAPTLRATLARLRARGRRRRVSRTAIPRAIASSESRPSPFQCADCTLYATCRHLSSLKKPAAPSRKEPLRPFPRSRLPRHSRRIESPTSTRLRSPHTLDLACACDTLFRSHSQPHVTANRARQRPTSTSSSSSTSSLGPPPPLRPLVRSLPPPSTRRPWRRSCGRPTAARRSMPETQAKTRSSASRAAPRPTTTASRTRRPISPSTRPPSRHRPRRRRRRRAHRAAPALPRPSSRSPSPSRPSRPSRTATSPDRPPLHLPLSSHRLRRRRRRGRTATGPSPPGSSTSPGSRTTTTATSRVGSAGA